MDIPVELIEAKGFAELGLLALPGVVGVGLGAREEDDELLDAVASPCASSSGSTVRWDFPTTPDTRLSSG